MQSLLLRSVVSASFFAIIACSANAPVAPRLKVETSVVNVLPADANYIAEVRIANHGTAAVFWAEGCHSIERQSGGEWVQDRALAVGCAALHTERLDAGSSVTRSFVLPRYAIIASGLEQETFRITLLMLPKPGYDTDGAQRVRTPPFRLR